MYLVALIAGTLVSTAALYLVKRPSDALEI